MKRTILVAILGLFAFVQSAHAQFYVGGSFHVNSRVTEKNSTFIGFSPDLGYSVGNWSYGACLDLTIEDGSTAFTANPYVEYYFWTSGPVSFFAEGGVSLTWNNGFSYEPYVAPGIMFTVSDHWSVLGHIGRLGYNSLNKTIEFSISKAASLSLGLYYSF